MIARLRLFPLNAVLFPGAVLNLHVFEARYKQLLADCMQAGDGFGVVLLRSGSDAGDAAAEPYDVGTIAQIGEVTPLPNDRYFVSTVGAQRFRIREIVSREPYLTVEAEVLPDELPRDADEGAEVSELARRVRAAFDEYRSLIDALRASPPAVVLPDDAPGTSFCVGDALQVADAMKQRLLELSSTRQRLSVELGFLRRLLPQLRRLLETRQRQAQSATEEESAQLRAGQARYFGKYFSRN